MTSRLQEIWNEAVKLDRDDQLELVERLIHQMRENKQTQYADLNELRGIGKGIWESDAQEYVNKLRDD